MTAAMDCWHCGQPLPPDPPRARIAGVEHAVCCHGCRAAAEWIDHLGLADYYRLRSTPALRPSDPASSERSTQAWNRPELARHVVRELAGDRREVLLLIDGIRCAACVWLIERALGAVNGVTTVQVNAAARRARVVFDPQRTDLSGVLAALARTGYAALPLDAAALDDSRQREARSALKRLVVAGFGAMQAMMYASALYLGAFTTMDPATRQGMRWLGLLVATPVVFYAAAPFFAGAVRALRARTLGMDVPVALAIALIYAASIVEALRGGGEVYFDSVSMFVFFLLSGRYLEMRARHRAGHLADAMARLAPAFADRLDDAGRIERIGAMELVVGDRVQVAQGERVPADGVLESSSCRVDESLLSGESVPVPKRAGDDLVGGSIVLEGPVVARIARVGADTALAGIAALVARAQSQRPRLAQTGERMAAGFVARVLGLAAICAIGWSFVDPARALTATLAVLVVSCPCAFALAVPAALTRALSVLAARGVFVVHTDAIENLALATHAVFDKTGTLTEPELALAACDTRAATDATATDAAAANAVATDATAADAALALAAALARGSRHPLSLALARAAEGLPAHTASDVRTVVGGGIEGTVEGRRLRLGQRAFALRTTSETELFRGNVVPICPDPINLDIAISDPLPPLGEGARRADEGMKYQVATFSSTTPFPHPDLPALPGVLQRANCPRQFASAPHHPPQAGEGDPPATPEDSLPRLRGRVGVGAMAASNLDAPNLPGTPHPHPDLPPQAGEGDKLAIDSPEIVSLGNAASSSERSENPSISKIDTLSQRSANHPVSTEHPLPRLRGRAGVGATLDLNSDAALLLTEDGHLLATFTLRERLRAGAHEALDALRVDGVIIEIASGDAQSKVAAIAQRLGIDTWHARMRPADKLERLHALRAQGARVLAVGDGINDAPVLAGADVAIALASGAELAQAAGDIVLDGSHLPALAQARAIACETLAVLRQNQRWALVYNLAVVPLGALGFVPPWLAAIGMSASSLGVILNALRIGRHLPATPASTSTPALASTTP
ncbi:MAG: heavy metal translocating P-type ATPase [Proteobacteria bacterium]|nr:heavy metal translocating P-type ATPase [Pseudomonadota bacterium]